MAEEATGFETGLLEVLKLTIGFSILRDDNPEEIRKIWDDQLTQMREEFLAKKAHAAAAVCERIRREVADQKSGPAAIKRF